MADSSFSYYNFIETGGKYDTLVIPATHWNYMKNFGWELVHANVRNDPTEVGRGIHTNSSLQPGLRGNFARNYNKIFKLEFEDRFKNVPYLLIRRRTEFNSDYELTNEFNKFTKNYLRLMRTKRLLRWRGLWLIVRAIVSAIFIFLGIVCGALSGLFDTDIGETVLNLIHVSRDSLPGDSVLKVLAIVFIAIGAIYFIYSLARAFHRNNKKLAKIMNNPFYNVLSSRWSCFLKHRAAYAQKATEDAMYNGYVTVRRIQYNNKNLMTRAQQKRIMQGRIIREAINSWDEERSHEGGDLYF